MNLQIKCYIKNKIVYKIDLIMNKEKLFKQLDENRLIYKSTKTGNTEIIYLDKFDRLEFNKDIEIIRVKEV